MPPDLYPILDRDITLDGHIDAVVSQLVRGCQQDFSIAGAHLDRACIFLIGKMLVESLRSPHRDP